MECYQLAGLGFIQLYTVLFFAAVLLNSNKTNAITSTKAPQPPQRELAPATPTRQPQVLRVGDRTHYSGAKGAMAVTCRGKELEVLNTRINEQGEQECEIKASGWCASYWLLSRSLKKVR